MLYRVAYHGISSEYLEDADSVSIPAENSLQISFFCSSLVGKNELIILSHDEFTTNFIKKVIKNFLCYISLIYFLLIQKKIYIYVKMCH